MAYNANIPLATDQISTSQSAIKDNFTAINSVLAIDHSTFGLPDEGHHYFTVGAAPHAATAAQVGIYAKTGVTSASPELWINKAASQIAFTEAVAGATGWTRLPSGIMLRWGSGSLGAGVQSAVIAFGGFGWTTTYSVQLTPSSQNGAAQDSVIAATAIGAANFTVSRNNSYKGTQVDFYYLAIGV